MPVLFGEIEAEQTVLRVTFRYMTFFLFSIHRTKNNLLKINCFWFNFHENVFKDVESEFCVSFKLFPLLKDWKIP